MQEKKEDTIIFVENLLNKLKNDTLTFSEQRRLTEFYIKETYISEHIDNNDEEENEKYIKYLTLGWYIYENLLIN